MPLRAELYLGENVLPEEDKLVAKLRGTYVSVTDDESALPDFYANYAETFHKPFSLSEAGSFYNTDNPEGAAELAIKQAWWEQIFDPALLEEFPLFTLVAWFEFAKTENEPVGQVIDWRTTVDPEIRDLYRSAVPESFLKAPIER